MLAETDVPLVGGTGTNEQWTFDIRGDTWGDVAAFHARCREVGIPVELTELHALTPVETATEQALTDKQQEALVLAYERGYYETPRNVTMVELGAELGISQQAVATRLRHGIDNVLEQTLPETEGSPHRPGYKGFV